MARVAGFLLPVRKSGIVFPAYGPFPGSAPGCPTVVDISGREPVDASWLTPCLKSCVLRSELSFSIWLPAVVH